ncbi:hypothetical protein HKD37_12G033918 [Glycine soja]
MNAKRREYMIGMLPKRIILMRHEKLQGNRDTIAYTTTPITSFSQQQHKTWPRPSAPVSTSAE